MRFPFRVSILPALLALFFSGPMSLGGQVPASMPPIDSGAVIRAWMGDVQVRGRLLEPLRPGADSVRYCRFPGPPCDIDPHPAQLGWLRPGELDHLERQVGNRAWRGALIGGGIVAALGYGIGSFARGSCERDCPSTGGVIIGSILGGALFGGPIGALIGSAFPKMERVF